MELTDTDESQDVPRQGLKMMEAVDVVSGDLVVEIPAFSPVNTDRQHSSTANKSPEKIRLLPTVI